MTLMTDSEKKPQILIVDDEEFMRRSFQDVLNRAGFITTVVPDGASAVESLKEVQCDLVLLDLIMPGKNGLDTCAEIRGIPNLEHTPILIVTGRGDSDTVTQAFEAGATDFMVKPVSPELLIHRVRYILRANQSKKKLLESEARLANAQRIIQLGNWEWDPVAGTFWGSAETFRILGMKEQPSYLPLETFLLTIYPPDRELVEAGLKNAHKNSSTRCFEFRIKNPDSSLRVLSLQAHAEATVPGKVPRITGTLQDITQMKQVEDRLRILKEAVDCLPIGVGITISDVHGKIIYSNPAEAEIHGYAPEELVGRDAGLFAPASLKRPLQRRKLRKIGLWKRESINIRKNGEIFPVQLSSIAVKNAEGRCIGIVTACEDISSRKEAERKIEWLAYYDTLTGLPNRETLLERLQQALAHARRQGEQVGLLFLDLDNFKDVNDTQGHDFGDKLLREVAGRLSVVMRESDTLARLGGDEFVMVLTGMKGHESLAATAQRVLSTFSRPFVIEGRQLYSNASIGIALYPDDGLDVESLLKSADTAMYHAKDEGRSHYQFFSTEMNQKIMRRVALENSLRQGLEKGEFFLHYQPQWDLKSGRITGVEALLRWQNDDFGDVCPSEFIALAEMSGLIFDLGERVLRTACIQARRWALAGHPDLKVAVNISGKQFRQPDFLGTIDRIIRETGVDPASLELEFTESVVMEKADKTIDTLRALKNMGLRLSIDDFGTGYSSLNYLKHFPIDRVKIDRSFVADVNHSKDDAAIVNAIISLAHSMNLKVIAEGVEDIEQIRFLTARDCDEVQGFYLARPMNARDVTRSLRDADASKIGTTGELLFLQNGELSNLVA